MQLPDFNSNPCTGSINENSVFKIVKILNVKDLGQPARLSNFKAHLHYSHQPIEHTLPLQISAQEGLFLLLPKTMGTWENSHPGSNASVHEILFIYNIECK